MTRNPARRLRRRTVSASLLALAVGRVAAAQTAPATTYESGTPSTSTPTSTPPNPYAGSQTVPTTVATPVGNATALALNGVLANGSYVVTDSNSSSPASSYVYLYGPNGAAPVDVGLTGGEFVNAAGTVNQAFRSANFNGAVAGQSTRYIPGSNASAGSDAFLYVPPTAAGATGTTINIGNQGVLGAVNTANAIDGNIYYDYAVTTTVNGTVLPGLTRTTALVASTNGITSAPAGINANNQVILTGTRFTGVSGQTLSLGLDAFLFTPATNGTATGTLTKVGLTGAPYYYYAQTVVGYAGGAGGTYVNAYQTSNSTPVALNVNGAVVGTTARYTPNTPSNPNTANFSLLGTDAWVYSGATSLGTAPAGAVPVGTVQVGLVGTTTQAPQGGYYSAQVATNNGLGNYEAATVVGISAAGAVTGSSTLYAANTSSTQSPSSLGANDAWQFKPTLTGGSGLTTATATGFGTTAAGTYVQLGLTAAPTATAIGYVANATGYVGVRTQTISSTNAAGNVAGTTARYTSGASSNSGADAWYYNGSSVSLITPAANPAYSAYLSLYGTFTTNTSSSSLSGPMSAAGIVAGTQNRYLNTSVVNAGVTTNTSTGVGTDVFAYNPVTNTTTVIASPALIANDADFAANASAGTAAEYFNGAVKSVSDNGLVVGTFTAYNGSTTSTPSLGQYVFAWTQQAGTIVLGSATNVSGGTIAALTLNTSSGTMNINVGNIFADANGDIFGQGTTSGGLPEVFEFAAAPEPTSLALVAAGLVPLVGRRRRRAAARG